MAWCEKIELTWSDFKLDVPRWEFPDEGITCVFGESGSGKTTLLHVLAGLIPCANFNLSLQGELITEQPAKSRNISFVFQDYGLFSHMSAFENIAFAAEAKKIPKIMWAEQAEKLIQRLGLERIRKQNARTLSGGEQQRVALARALISKPRMICLDEPFSALDERMRDDARELIQELSVEYKVPFVLVTHDLRDVRALSASLLLLDQGKVTAAGPTHELLNSPKTLKAAKAIPENQIIDLQALVSGPWDLASILTQIRRAPSVEIPCVVAKPWSFEAVAADAKTKGLKAEVLHTLNEGARRRVHCKLANGQKFIAWSALDVQPGQDIDLKIDVNSLILFESLKTRPGG